LCNESFDEPASDETGATRDQASLKHEAPSYNIDASSSDLLLQLRAGWDIALEFALKRPALFSLLWQHARAQPALVADAHALMHARVQRLVDTGRFQGPVDTAALAVWAASQGLLSVVHQGPSRKEVEALSELLFNAVVNKLSTVECR
jgi:hypothetical protein